jgi:hypothetical protein
MRLGKLPLLQRALFSGAAISLDRCLLQIPRRTSISHYRLSECLWRVSLKLNLNHSLLNKKYALINVLKTLSLIVSIFCLYVILLSKITLRYFTWLTKLMLRSFSFCVRWASTGLTLWKKYMAWVLFSLILWSIAHITSQLHREFSADFWKHILLCGLSHMYRRHPQRDLDIQQMFGRYHLHIHCTMLGAGRNLMSHLLGVDISPSTDTLEFSLREKSQYAWFNWMKVLVRIIYVTSQSAMLYEVIFRHPRIPQL